MSCQRQDILVMALQWQHWRASFLRKQQQAYQKGLTVWPVCMCRGSPGGDLLRWPSLVIGMNWYMLRDKLGF